MSPPPRRPPRPIVRERDVLKSVMAACAAYGVLIRRVNTGAMRNTAGRLVRFGRRGDLDTGGLIVTGPLRGVAIAIETKRPGKRPTAEQVGRMIEINAAGGIAFWVDDAATCSEVLRRVVLDGCRVEVYPDGSQEIVVPDQVGVRSGGEIEGEAP